jgi:hypothetical protein
MVVDAIEEEEEDNTTIEEEPEPASAPDQEPALGQENKPKPKPKPNGQPRPKLQSRVCANCGKKFQGTRAAWFCRPACRQEMYRKRKEG